MAPRPPWAQQSDIWNSVSEANQNRTLLGMRILDQANGGKINQLLTHAEQRLVLEVYKVYCGGPYPRLEAYAHEQFISPSAENDIIESNQIGSCIGQIFNREHALNNCFSISSQNAGFQTRTFLQCVYDDAGNLFPTLVEPAQNPFNDADPDDILQRDATTSALSNRHLVGEHSFVFIEGIQVQTSHRRRGVGRALLNALLAEAAAILPSIRFAASWPCASDGDLDDLVDVVHFRSAATANDGAGCSPRRSGLGQKRAEAFHRAAGFRRLGLTRFWAKSLG